MSFKGILYSFIILFAFIIGAFSYGLFIIYKKIIFPVIMSMQFHELHKSGDVVLQNKMVNYRGRIHMVPVNEKCGALSDVYFLDKELMKKTYEKLLLKKLITYLVIFILGLCIIVFNSEVWYLIVLVWIILTIHFLLDIKKTFRIYSSVKNEEYMTKSVDVKGITYYRAFFEHEKSGETKEISLFDTVM